MCACEFKFFIPSERISCGIKIFAPTGAILKHLTWLYWGCRQDLYLKLKSSGMDQTKLYSRQMHSSSIQIKDKLKVIVLSHVHTHNSVALCMDGRNLWTFKKRTSYLLVFEGTRGWRTACSFAVFIHLIFARKTHGSLETEKTARRNLCVEALGRVKFALLTYVKPVFYGPPVYTCLTPVYGLHWGVEFSIIQFTHHRNVKRPGMDSIDIRDTTSSYRWLIYFYSTLRILKSM